MLGSRKAPDGTEGSGSLSLFHEGGHGLQDQFPFRFNAPSNPWCHWACGSPVAFCHFSLNENSHPLSCPNTQESGIPSPSLSGLKERKAMALEAESLALDQRERTVDYLPSGFAEEWFLDAN